MSKKNPLSIVGKTPNEELVISGLLRFEETHGLPLEDILEYVKVNNFVPSWLHIIDEAKNQGVNVHKFLTKLESCIVVVYGRDYWSTINTYLTQYALKESNTPTNGAKSAGQLDVKP